MPVSIKPGFNAHVKELSHGTLASAICSIISEQFLKGSDKPISLEKIAREVGAKLEHVVDTCRELEVKGLLIKNVEGDWSAISTIIPHFMTVSLAVSQKGLFGADDKSQPKNPLGLFVGHEYLRTIEHDRWTFRVFDQIALTYNFEQPGKAKKLEKLSLIEADVRATFDLASGKLAGSIGQAELDPEGLRIERVSPEVFTDLKAKDATASLAKKVPTAEFIVTFDQKDLVVTGVTEDSVYLTPCAAVAKKDKSGECFRSQTPEGKPGSQWYQLASPAERLVAKLSSVDEVVAAAPVDLFGFVKDWHERGFHTDGIVKVRPRSFAALFAEEYEESVEPHEGASIVVQGITVECSAEGLDIDGYEDAAAVVEGDKPALEVVAGGE